MRIRLMKLGKKETFCPRLWDEVYINGKGNVFSCCHEKPKIIGNIYKEKLKGICNNEIIQNLRQKSLNGRLECFDDCTLLKENEIVHLEKTLTINYNELARLKILFSEACNINCIMCWQDSRNKECLDYEKLVGNVDIAPFELIEIQGGEPLFIEAAKIFFDYAASKGKKVSFMTNGILIDEKWAKKIALHSSCLYFSLNAATKRTHEFINRGSKWEAVLKNIQKVRDAREKYCTDVKILGHMTIVRENLEEIPLFIKKFKQLGFDSIEFGYDESVPSYLRVHPFKKTTLRLKIREAIKHSEVRSTINVHRLKLLGFV